MSTRMTQYKLGWRGGEPTLADALSDPLTRALMAADGVDPRELEADLRNLGRSLARRVGVFAECGGLDG